MPQRAFCEWLGTAFLLAAVVGSAVMAQKLAGDGAVALLCNTLPTGAILAVLILIFGPLSGAHFNPAVSIAFALRGDLPWSTAVLYFGVQVLGGLFGVWVAHHSQCGSSRSPSARVRDNGWRKVSRLSVFYSLSSAAFRIGPIPFLTPSASTSRRPIGSRLRRPSLTPPSLLRGRFLIPSRG
jgi:Major intrinsic protein